MCKWSMAPRFSKHGSCIWVLMILAIPEQFACALSRFGLLDLWLVVWASAWRVGGEGDDHSQKSLGASIMPFVWESGPQ